ncbi:uncharacterized protein RHOBADRAFT_50712 [Rhodotorula graminis WP1]|uniref:Enoyl reductase (ER) domain-containing protein n=1 Tax=Rhodotorula graminis (strain WP1) TaxID=578459 RepID=A0A194SBW0_RHOGW|nr:uncharacterized protein RHOBADRAFT_50712 [Rhodotorula graminis WP1]KPV78218.1 hypothetical protein RHOBADRAFT_50712 [Rhodotorula graminis WP1]
MPASLGPNELLVQVYAASLNPVDAQLRNLAIFRLPALAGPHGIGCDFAGTVLGRGKDANEFEVGAEVMGVTVNPLAGPNGGTLSELCVVDLSRSTVVPKPPHLSWTQAAALPLVFLTARTVLSPPYLVLPPPPAPAHGEPTSSKSRTSPRPTVVVLGGASAVGQHVVQLASKRMDLRVVASCSARSADLVRSLGAHETVDYEADDVAERLAALRPTEGEGGFLAIIDCVGGTSLLPSVPRLLSPRTRAFPAGGSYTTIVGDKTSRAALGGSFLYLTCWAMLYRLLRGWMGLGYRYACINFKNDASWLAEAADLTKGGDDDYIVSIDGEYAYEDVAEAFAKVIDGKARGKVVVRVKEP